MNIKRNIIFSLEKRKKNGVAIIDNIPIRIRVVYVGKRIEFTTGYRIDASKWDEAKQRVKNGCVSKLKQSASQINSDLSKYFFDLDSIFKEYEVKRTVPTPKQIKDRFNEIQNKNTKTNNKNTLINVFDVFIRESGKQNNWTDSTIKKLTTIKNHLQTFDKELTFDSVTLEVLSQYVDYMHNINLRNNTISKQINLLKWFLRWSIEQGYTKNNIFESFKPKLKTTPKKVVFLTWDELTQLREYDIPETKKYLERVRDVFLFCCFTGLRYSDVYSLKRSNVKENYIELVTVKTNDNLIIELNDYSRSILDKYKDVRFENNKVLPVISNQKMNDYLKELGELAGLNEAITEIYYKGNERIEETAPKYALLGTHAGRRTFICNALALGISPQVVMSWSGHSDYTAMKPYIAISDKSKHDAMKLFDAEEKKQSEKLIQELKKLTKEELEQLLKKI